MKILIIHSFYRETGGEDNMVLEKIALLKAAGFDVELLGFQNPTKFLDSIVDLFFLLFNVSSFIKTLKKIRGYRPDIIHLHNWHFAASPSVIFAAHVLKTPLVLTAHNFRLLCPSAILFNNGELFLESLKEKFPWTAIKIGVYRNSSLQTFWLAFCVFVHKKLKTWQKVSKFIVLSDFMKDIFLQSSFGIAADKFVTKQNSIPDPIVWAKNGRGKHFAFVGRLVVEKGIEVLLKAFANTEFQLHIYGYGPLEQKVRDFAELHPNISFKGALPHENLFAELRKCSALIFPSIWYEGMPLTVIEGLSTGTPIIASNLGAMSTMIQNHSNGLHFEAGNPLDLAQKLAYWSARSEEEKAQYSQRARATYEENYTPEANLRRLLAIYSGAINEYKLKLKLTDK
ncbi:MAG: glycosyltransferase family 4 protein [Haliscomenobacter sp.]|uniref:glycosyltransferase family 4 protein n=1 Tax=Haliscomenobacter sp. TaxID=2717303 RepID=UPI0029B4736D|nr:glycosyltransferase family 4 protein [Haliscomenobacter sp.]MDX2072289.1 glycosyltransferase family 4 protein [Haliscomenobacter sp.]